MIAAAATAPAELFEAPGGGHPVGPTLAEAGLLSRLLRGVLREGRRPPGFAAEMLAALPRSPSYHRHLALSARGPERLAHIRNGLALASPDFRLRFALAQHLSGAGQVAEALDEARAALAQRPLHPRHRALVAELERSAAAAGEAVPPTR